MSLVKALPKFAGLAYALAGTCFNVIILYFRTIMQLNLLLNHRVRKGMVIGRKRHVGYATMQESSSNAVVVVKYWRISFKGKACAFYIACTCLEMLHITFVLIREGADRRIIIHLSVSARATCKPCDICISYRRSSIMYNCMHTTYFHQ